MTTTEIEYRIFKSINQWAAGDSFVNQLMIFFAEYAEYIFVIGLLVYWFTRKQRNRQMVLQTALAACTALAVNKVLGHLLYRSRPFVDHDVIQLIAHDANASFPSNHAAATFVIATAIWLFRKKEGRLWLILASIVSLSRIWVGVHYPLDILGGMMNGILCAVVIHIIFTRWAWANRVLYALLRVYEQLEQRIWVKNEPSQTTKPYR
ncbi:undecaprenyl-diphosphatase [Paenibacillus sp. J2TS4]|uniref:undecaprenyl-diphosphatase n=1 Tax=Paenibacillus sp. J2TS4 TaxID=2807194 RepID=UPI001B29F644|nr:undecaprenyl-diphosphatase [Paenibacillus sp. J2TS4]GIP32801.1 undecaprenyl-diphosphatase [Paenibacillus sp. J2TS4]